LNVHESAPEFVHESANLLAIHASCNSGNFGSESELRVSEGSSLDQGSEVSTDEEFSLEPCESCDSTQTYDESKEEEEVVRSIFAYLKKVY
jgi:hypothetical protein